MRSESKALYPLRDKVDAGFEKSNTFVAFHTCPAHEHNRIDPLPSILQDHSLDLCNCLDALSTRNFYRSPLESGPIELRRSVCIISETMAVNISVFNYLTVTVVVYCYGIHYDCRLQ